MKSVILPFDNTCLEIGDSYSCLRCDVEIWILRNCKDWYLRYNGKPSFGGTGYVIDFDCEEDSVLFKLRWL